MYFWSLIKRKKKWKCHCSFSSSMSYSQRLTSLGTLIQPTSSAALSCIPSLPQRVIYVLSIIGVVRTHKDTNSIWKTARLGRRCSWKSFWEPLSLSMLSQLLAFALFSISPVPSEFILSIFTSRDWNKPIIWTGLHQVCERIHSSTFLSCRTVKYCRINCVIEEAGTKFWTVPLGHFWAVN